MAALAEAEDALAALLARREDALGGRGLMPAPAAIAAAERRDARARAAERAAKKRDATGQRVRGVSAGLREPEAYRDAPDAATTNAAASVATAPPSPSDEAAR